MQCLVCVTDKTVADKVKYHNFHTKAFESHLDKINHAEKTRGI